MAETRRGSEWHIGQIEVVDKGSIAFQLGRTIESITPQFNEEEKVFYEAFSEKAPYTIAVFDLETQACGVLKKSGVSQSATEISNTLERLLNSTKFPAESDFHIVVEALRDPEDFIAQINESHSVTRYSFTARFDNSFDVEELIQRPAERFTKAAGGNQTTVEVEGENLDKRLLIDLTRGVASTNDKATATVRPTINSKSKRISLSGMPLLQSIFEAGPVDGVREMIQRTREAYDRLRHSLQ